MTNNVVPLHRRMRPIADAYSYARMAEPCPHCGADPHNHCRYPDAITTRRVPCVARLHKREPATGLITRDLRIARDPNEARCAP